MIHVKVAKEAVQEMVTQFTITEKMTTAEEIIV